MKRDRTMHALGVPAQREAYASFFVHANAAQCSQKWQSLACVFMQQLEQSVDKKNATCRSGIFLKHY